MDCFYDFKGCYLPFDHFPFPSSVPVWRSCISNCIKSFLSVLVSSRFSIVFFTISAIISMKRLLTLYSLRSSKSLQTWKLNIWCIQGRKLHLLWVEKNSRASEVLDESFSIKSITKLGEYVSTVFKAVYFQSKENGHDNIISIPTVKIAYVSGGFKYLCGLM